MLSEAGPKPDAYKRDGKDPAPSQRSLSLRRQPRRAQDKSDRSTQTACDGSILVSTLELISCQRQGTVWYGLFVHARTSPAIVEWLNRETVKIMNSPHIRTRITNLGNEPLTNTLKEFAEIIERERPFWARVIRDAGVKQIE
jgi:hypothetical protein